MLHTSCLPYHALVGSVLVVLQTASSNQMAYLWCVCVCVSGPSYPCGGVDSVFVLFGIPDYTRNMFLWRVLLAVTPLGQQLRF